MRDAEAWFVGAIPTPSRLSDAVVEFADREAARKLETIEYDDDLRDLLPYVLDAHGPREQSQRHAGSPYGESPAREERHGRVLHPGPTSAEYIVRETLEAHPPEVDPPLVLDPACGSGVFLKAVLNLAAGRRTGFDRLEFVERHLHGIDIDPLGRRRGLLRPAPRVPAFPASPSGPGAVVPVGIVSAATCVSPTPSRSTSPRPTATTPTTRRP